MNSNPRRKFWLIAAGCVVLLALLIAGLKTLPLLGTLFGNSSDSPGAEVVRPVQVEAARAEKTTLHPSLDLVGQIVAIPERTAVVSSQSGGWVASVAVVEGQAVRASDTLVTLDSRLAKSEVLRAKAGLAEKQAALARLKHGFLPEEVEAARQARDGAAPMRTASAPRCRR